MEVAIMPTIENVEINGVIEKVERPDGMSDAEFSDLIIKSFPDMNAETPVEGQPDINNMLPSATGELEPIVGEVTSPNDNSFLDDAQDFMRDTSRIAGDIITDVGGTALKSTGGIVAGITGQGDKAVEAGLATPEGVKVGESALQAVPIGAGVGITTSMLGKTALPSYLAISEKKIPRALSDFLFTAASDPKRVVALESVIAAVAEGADEAAVQSTGSEIVGTVAGLLTGVLAPQRIAKHIMPAYMAKEDYVDATLAGYLRDNPEILARAESNLGKETAADFGIRLDLLAKDDNISMLTKDLANVSPNLFNLHKQSTTALQIRLTEAIDSMTLGRLTPEQASKHVEDMINQISTKRDSLISSLPDATGSEAKVALDSFERLIESSYGVAKQSINRAYSKVALDVPLGMADKIELKRLVKSLRRKETASGLDVKKSGIKRISEALQKEAQAIGEKEGKKKAGGTAHALNQVRGLALELMRKRAKKGRNNERLNEAVSGITKLLEGHPELADANAVYRQFKEVFDNGSISKFFVNGTDGTKVVGAESFAREFFMSNRPKERIDELRKFVDSDFAKAKGIDWVDIQTAAHDAFIAKLRTSGELTPSIWKKFVATNGEALEQLGLKGGFESYSDVVNEVAKQSKKISDSVINKLAIAKFGFSASPRALRNAAITNRSSLIKEIAALPANLRDPARKAVLDALVKDSKGRLLPSSELNDMLLRHARAFGMSEKTMKHISVLTAHLDVPSGAEGVAFREFKAALKSDPSIVQRIKSVLLERITRPTLKAVRVTSFLSDVAELKQMRSSLHEALLTEDGARRILALARTNPKSATVIRGILYGRVGLLEAAEGDE